MILPSPAGPMPGTVLLLSAWLAVGILLGAAYFLALWWNARLFATGGRPLTAALLLVGRLALVAAGLIGASLHGGLLPVALGVLAGRFAVMRGVRAVAP